MAESSVRVLFLGDSAGAVRSVNSLERSFTGLGRAAKMVAGGLAVGIVGGLAAATKAAIDFDKAMHQVNSIAGLNQQQLKALEKQVLSMAKTTGQAPKTLADGLYDIVSSGFKATDGLKILKASAVAATAGLTDTATSTKAVVAVLNAYHESAGKAGHVSDVLFETVNKGVLNFQELAQQIGDVLPVASQLGIPLEDVGGALATITLHGVDAAEASTQLKQVITSLLKPSDALKKTLHDMGFESGEAAIKQIGLEGIMRKLTIASKGSAAAFADWFPNVRAMNGALGLTGKNIAVLHQNIVAMNHSQGAAASAFAEQGKSIAVQWQKAKAGLTAAAIPIGQLLFPALAKAAAKVQDFAQGIQSHMPQIRAEFQSLSGTVTGFAKTLGQIAISPAGSSALLGGLAAVGTLKGLLGTKNAIEGLVKGVGELPLPLALAAAGVGALVASIVYGARQTPVLTKELQAAANAARELHNATSTARTAQLQLSQAQLNVTTTADEVTASEHLYAKAVQQSGRDSTQARAAFEAIRQARINHKQAVLDETAAVENARKASASENAAKRATAKTIGDLKSKADALAHSYASLSASQARNAAAGEAQDAALTASNAQMKAQLVDQYANAIAAVTKALGGTQAQADAAASAVEGLSAALGRLPTRKEVDVFVKTFQTGSFGAAETNRGKGGAMGHAAGALIPMSAGVPGRDSVPAMLTPGEMILNQGQQDALGGTAYLARIFGFSGGGVVPGVQLFAAGGIAKPKPRRRAPGRNPKAGRGHRIVRQGNYDTRVTQMDTRLQGVQDNIDVSDRQYGELVDKFDVDDRSLQFILTDANGNEYIDDDAVSQRSGEIQQLLAKKEELRTLYAQKAAVLAEYVKLLQAAIKAMKERIRQEKAAIAREQARLRSDAAQVKQLQSMIYTESLKKKVKTKDAKGHVTTTGGPNESLLKQWRRQISLLHGDETDTRKRLSSDQGLLRTDSGQLTKFQGSLGDEQRSLRFNAFDVKDNVDSPEYQLRGELADIDPGALARQVADFNAAAAAGAAGGSGAGSQDLQALVAALTAQLAQSRLALGVQGIQLPILGSFQRGSVKVAVTGLYQLHGGEKVTQAGVPDGIGGDGVGPIVLELHLDGSLSALESTIDARVVANVGNVSIRQGQEASRRERGGRA